MHDLNRSPHLLLHIRTAYTHDASHWEQTSPGWRWTGVTWMSVRRAATVHSCVQARVTTTTRKIPHYCHIKVRCMDDIMLQRASSIACAHHMLLCVLCTGAQMPFTGNRGENTNEQRKEQSIARSVQAASTRSNHTDRMEVAEPT